MNYVKLLEKEITETTFSNAQELKTTLDKALETIKSREEIKKDFIEAGLFSEVDATQTGFYTHFLKLYNDINVLGSDLNVDNVTSFNIDGEEFIKYQDSEGDYRVIENNDTSKNYIDQIKDKQNSSIDFQINNAETNKQEILKSMTDERKEIQLESSTNASYDNMNNQEMENFNSIVNHEMFKDRNLIFNAEKNMYIDKDSGEVFYVIINDQNLREIRKANEDYTVSNKDETIKYDDTLTEHTVETEKPGIEYTSLTDSDLYYLVESNDVSIPEIAKKNAKAEIERRKKLEENNKGLTKKEKPKEYILTPNKSSNGFASFLMLTLITSIYGIGFLTYLYLLIK